MEKSSRVLDENPVPDLPSQTPLASQGTEPDLDILTALAELPPLAVVSEQKLAQLVQRHPASVKRAIQRGELPPPVPWFGQNIWTVQAILDHLSARLEDARKAADQTTRRLQHLRPVPDAHGREG
jgi:hypothetical protein